MRKKLFISFLALLVLLTSCFNHVPIFDSLFRPSLAEASNLTLKLQIGNSKMYVGDYVVDLHTAPEISNGFTYIPITAIAKGFGAYVEYVPSTKGIIITLFNIKIGLSVESDTAVLNGNVVSIPAVFLKDGIPMVPLKVFVDGLGVSLNSDPATQIITMSGEYVSFDPNVRWITVLYPENGSIEPARIVAVDIGTSLTFNIAPSDVSTLKDVKVDGVSVGAVSTYTFANITQDHTIGAYFTIQSFTINASAGLGGTVTPIGVITVANKSSQTFVITPDEGYAIKDVKVDNQSVGAVSIYTFNNIASNHIIHAEFKKEISSVVNIGLTIGSKIAFVNGASYTLDVPATIIENRTYVPLRFVAEQLGCDVNYRDSDKKVTIINGENKIELWIGKNIATVNGKLVPIDSANSKVVPVIQNGRTLVPIRFISESLGFYVDYNSSKKLVTISNTPIVSMDNAIGYFEKTVTYNGKSYNFKVVKVDPKANGLKFVPSLSINGFNKGADYKTFLLPNTLVMVNGIPFDTNTFDVSGTIFGNSIGEIEAGTSETFIIDQNGNCFYEEGRIEVTTETVSVDGSTDSLTTYSINSTSWGGFTIYTNWYKDNINVNFGEVFVIINSTGNVISKVDGPLTIIPSQILKNGQFGIYAYQHSTAHWIKDTVSIFGSATNVNLRIMINGRDITKSFFVQSSPVVVRDGVPFDGAARYPDSYRMTKYGARVFIATDGRYVYFIVTPTAMSLRSDPVGDIILRLGYFKYVLSLDGGGSTTLYYKDRFIYTPGRNLVTCVSVVGGMP